MKIRHDITGEQKVSEFLKSHLYTPLKGQSLNTTTNLFDFDIIKTIGLQTKGVDVICYTQNIADTASPLNSINIDEKSAIYSPNYLTHKNYDTFAFELKSNINSHNNHTGWLFGTGYSQTDYYLINWLTISGPITETNSNWKFWWQYPDYAIQSIESLLINKKKLQGFVIATFAAYSSDKLLPTLYNRADDLDTYMKKHGTINNHRSYVRLTDYAHLTKTMTSNMPEEPINIVIDKFCLKRLATLQVLTSANSLPIIKYPS